MAVENRQGKTRVGRPQALFCEVRSTSLFMPTRAEKYIPPTRESADRRGRHPLRGRLKSSTVHSLPVDDMLKSPIPLHAID